MNKCALAALFLVAASAGLKSTFAEDSNHEKPNILVIFIDGYGVRGSELFW